MTRKHYIMFARLISRQISKNYLHTDALQSFAIELADELARDNPQFDRSRFLAACKPEGAGKL